MEKSLPSYTWHVILTDGREINVRAISKTIAMNNVYRFLELDPNVRQTLIMTITRLKD